MTNPNARHSPNPSEIAIALITHERIETTITKAKELRKFAEPFITLGKTDSVANRRLAMSRLGNRTAVQKLFSTEFKARFDARPGGYTRILKMDTRLGDGAEMALIELVDYALPEAVEPEGE